MKKKHAFFISLFVTLLVAGNYLFFAAGTLFPERELVTIFRVIDGDTVELADGRTIRLLNINAAEKGRPWATEATAFLQQYENQTIELETAGVGTYGRILGRFYADTYLNLELVKQGLAHPYIVKEHELDTFKETEKDAQTQQKGMWKHSEHYNCLEAEINKKEEFVIITDHCDINTKEYTLKDESTKQYTFSRDISSQITLYSRPGTDTEETSYWKRGNAWNDDKDSIFIWDSEGSLVFYDSYGY